MDAVVDWPIALWKDFKTVGPLAQFSLIVAVLGLNLAPFGALWGWTESQESRRAREAVALRRDLAAAAQAKELMQDEIDPLKRLDPGEVLRRVELERRDANRSRLITETDAYLMHRRKAFGESCRVLTDHHLSWYERQQLAQRRLEEKVLGPEHPDKIVSSTVLATPSTKGDLSEALRLFEETLAIETRVLGAENRRTECSQRTLEKLGSF